MPNLYFMGHSPVTLICRFFWIFERISFDWIYIKIILSWNLFPIFCVKLILRFGSHQESFLVTSAKISKFVGRKNKVSLVLPESFCIFRSFCPNLLQAIKILIEVNIIYHTLWSCLRRVYWLKYSCCVILQLYWDKRA